MSSVEKVKILGSLPWGVAPLQAPHKVYLRGTYFREIFLDNFARSYFREVFDNFGLWIDVDNVEKCWMMLNNVQ